MMVTVWTGFCLWAWTSYQRTRDGVGEIILFSLPQTKRSDDYESVQCCEYEHAQSESDNFYLHLGLQKGSASPTTSCKAPTLHHIFTYYNPPEIINWGTMESVRQVNHRRPSVATNYSFFLHLSYPFLANLSYCQSFQSTAIFVTRA